jgi:Sigma-70, region 4
MPNTNAYVGADGPLEIPGREGITQGFGHIYQGASHPLRKRRRRVYVSIDEPTGEPEAVSRSEQLADHSPYPEDQCQHSQLSTRLTHLYSQLSRTLSRAFRLRDVEGLSIRETARVLRIPRGTVKARSAGARQQLKKLMQRALRPRSRGLSNNQPGAKAKPQYTNKNVLC